MRGVVGLTLAWLGVVAGANLLVDPFGIYPVPARPGFNQEKAGQHGHDRMVKAYAIKRIRPDVLLLGTSRVQYGLDPADTALGPWGARPYNAGLLGSNVYTALRYLQHAQAVSPLRLAVVGLDPLMFDDAPATELAAGRDFLEERLCADPTGRPQMGVALGDAAATLLSWDALRLSLRTVRKQKTLVTDLLPNGQRSPEALTRFFAEAGSTRASFLSTEKSYVADYAAAVLPSAAGPSTSFDHFGALLSFARANGIALVLYFTPQHVRLHEVTRQAGMQPAVQAWQRRVAEAVALANAASAGQGGGAQPAIALWNMSILNTYTTEEVPDVAAKMAPLEWFWESTHGRDRLGHLMLTRMLAPAEADVLPAVRAVGEQSSVQNLEAQQQGLLDALLAWERAHPADVAEVTASMQQTRHATGQ